MNETEPSRYEIRIQGHLEPRRLDCFANLRMSHYPGGETSIVGTLDPAALHGLLMHLYYLGTILLSVKRVTESKEKKNGT